MDVVDTRPTHVSEARRRRRIPLVIELYVVLAGLVVATVLVGLHLRAVANRDDARQAVVAAARQQAVDLLTIDYRTATRDLQRIIDGSTGDQQRLYRDQLTAFPGVLRQTKSVSTGQVIAAGLVSYGHGKAEVAVAVNQSVRSAAANGQVNTARRMVLDLVRVHGRWLVSKQTFVGQGVVL
jgi:Mce-associated membrane protein